MASIPLDSFRATLAAILIVGCGVPEPSNPYPLEPEMLLLEKDASSEGYRQHLRGFHVNDLHAEWHRTSLPDGPARFGTMHGGLEKIRGNPALLDAYERRRRIADAFLSVLRAEYERRGEAVPSGQPEGDEGRELRPDRVDTSLVIEPLLPAPAAERQWPGWRGPSRQGISTETDLPVAWSASFIRTQRHLFSIGKRPGQSTAFR